MPLESIHQLMDRARAGRYAVGYFESWNLESLQGTLDAAEETRSPVIIGFNGEFMSHAERTVPERLELYGRLGRAAAESAKVPCGLIFNECCQDEWLRNAVTAGFNLIMPSNEKSPDVQTYQAWVEPLTQYTHGHGVAVEAEIGTLPCGPSATKGELTDADVAARFCRETQVDLLAVSAGNVHVLIRGKQSLDLAHLATLVKRVPVPLVLHGGTGIDDQSLRAAVELGVAKVNFGTNLKQSYLAALRAGLERSEENPHRLLGFGGEQDLLVRTRRVVRDAIVAKMQILGCMGKGF